MKDKTIEIKTLKDIIDKVPKGSIDIFLVDLKSWIELTHKGNELKKQLPGMIEHDDTIIQWLDDGQNQATINIEFIPTQPTND